MSDNVKCKCGIIHDLNGIVTLCGCTTFRPAEEVNLEPATESVYERARKALRRIADNDITGRIEDETAVDFDLVARGINAGETAEAKIVSDREIYESCADGGGCAKYIEAIQRAEAAERTGRALVATAEDERDSAVRFAEKRAEAAEARVRELEHVLAKPEGHCPRCGRAYRFGEEEKARLCACCIREVWEGIPDMKKEPSDG